MRFTRRSWRLAALAVTAAAGTTLAACSDTSGTGDSALNLDCTVPTSQIFDGGPGRDGIPALEFPEIARAPEAGFLQDEDRVLGIEINGQARAYPLLVMWWHEVVNDSVGGQPVLISYCPLTGSGLAFDPVVSGQLHTFGVSGLLFENNLIMFDRQTESLWNQLLLGAQCGPERGRELRRLPIIETTWGRWRTLYPQTTVITTNTGFDRSYGAYPYGVYDIPSNDFIFFPSSPWDPTRLPKELVLGVHDGTDAVAYPFGILQSTGNAVALNDSVGQRPVLVTYLGTSTRPAIGPGVSDETARAFDRRVDGQTLTFTVADSTLLTFTDAQTGSTWNALGEATSGPLAGIRLKLLADAYTLFWFSWSVYHPNTRLFLNQ